MSRGRYTVPKDGGGFPRKHRFRVDADLIAPVALHSSRVEAFTEFVSSYWRPEGDILLLSPCSNVKPYPLSPLNRKIESGIRKIGAWKRIEWVFISDLLGPVPYEYTWVHPACCYDANPSTIPFWWLNSLREILVRWWRRVKGYFSHVITHLPASYTKIVDFIYADNVPVTSLSYDIFYGQRHVIREVAKLLGQ